MRGFGAIAYLLEDGFFGDELDAVCCDFDDALVLMQGKVLGFCGGEVL
jgi:hypothetical protein